MTQPILADIADRTDAYFSRTREIAERFGDATVTYALFLRRPVIAAPRLAVEWLDRVAEAHQSHFAIAVRHSEGEWVGAGEPILLVTGSLVALAEAETILLQKLGAACVAGGATLRRGGDAGADGLCG
jgi:nicotinate phosphoribosyltransferase